MDKQTLLASVTGPEDLKKLSMPELETLSHEIRAQLLRVVSQNGGHLAPNLGVVELSIALDRVFNSPHDRILFDVGHQSYVHKLLTGRQEEFQTLRQYQGCSGFPQPQESPHDAFIAGHAGNAISAALGYAAAFARLGRRDKVIAVVGDGALNCGISLEGLNNIANNGKNLIIILNDNKMSIGHNVGALANHLNRMITARRYNQFKAAFKAWLGNEALTRKISRFLDTVKQLLMPKGSIFEQLGLRYIGPINGHNLPDLLRTLEAIKTDERPVLVHVVTQKGHGYAPAQKHPDRFHGISPFFPESGELRNPPKTTFSGTFGKTMVELAAADERIVAISAGMTAGTGLGGFSAEYPRRFFDVGIAEEHAVIFAAGLAAGGLRPVVAVYSTFLMRAFDCIFHDVCLPNLSVVIAIDRAGVVEDGPTHHGIYDLAFLRTQPNLTILNPADCEELDAMLRWIFAQERGPVAIRYPRGGKVRQAGVPVAPIVAGKAEERLSGTDGVIWALGAETALALEVAEVARRKYQLDLGVVNARFVQPLDVELLRSQAAEKKIYTLEDHRLTGGFGSAVRDALQDSPHRGVLCFGWGSDPIAHGAVSKLREAAGLTAEKIAERIAQTN